MRQTTTAHRGQIEQPNRACAIANADHHNVVAAGNICPSLYRAAFLLESPFA